MKAFCIPKVLASQNMEVYKYYKYYKILRFTSGFACSVWKLLSFQTDIPFGECGSSIMSTRLERVVDGLSEKYSLDQN